jgi:DNA modification methylase
MQVFPRAAYALAKEHAHAYVFCDIDRFPELRTRMSEAGWKVHRTPLVWHNPDGFRAPWPKQGPQRRYELILYAVKGDKPVTAIREDVLKYGKDTSLGHPAQKPVALLVDLLKRSAQPGDRVFDPCAGSGAIIEAAHELKLTCVALEKIPAAYGIAVKRLRGLIELEMGLF